MRLRCTPGDEQTMSSHTIAFTVRDERVKLSTTRTSLPLDWLAPGCAPNSPGGERDGLSQLETYLHTLSKPESD